MFLKTSLLYPKSFLLKFKALMHKHAGRTLEDFSYQHVEDEELDSSFHLHFYKLMGILAIAAGTTLLLRRLGMKHLAPKVSPKDRKEALTLRKALKSTHTAQQKSLWEDIRRSQEEKDSLTNNISTSLLNESPGKTSFGPMEFVSTLLFSKKAGILEAKSKWLSMQMNKYESSLNHNQLVIYKNLYETEMRILGKVRILKAVLFVGIPIIMLHIVGATQANNLSAWDKAMDKKFK